MRYKRYVVKNTFIEKIQADVTITKIFPLSTCAVWPRHHIFYSRVKKEQLPFAFILAYVEQRRHTRKLIVDVTADTAYIPRKYCRVRTSYEAIYWWIIWLAFNS